VLISKAARRELPEPLSDLAGRLLLLIIGIKKRQQRKATTHALLEVFYSHAV
jgi:hypothetical protein